MAMLINKKRKLEQGSRPQAPVRKKFKKQTHYSSGPSDDSESEPTARDVPKPIRTIKLSTGDEDSRRQPKSSEGLKESPNAQPAASNDKNGKSSSKEEVVEDEEQGSSNSEERTDSSTSDSGADSENDSDASSSKPKRTKTKRHDPDAFASSINAILSSKLSTSKRTDPVLSRSKNALEASQSLADSTLDFKARRRIRDEKRAASEKGRAKDILLGDRKDVIGSGEKVLEGGMSAAEIAQQEKRLRKAAQRGGKIQNIYCISKAKYILVVKLFNAVRLAQVKGEEEARRAKESGVIGSKRREEKVGEMGRKAFLDLVSGGG